MSSLLVRTVTFCLWSLVARIVFPFKGHLLQGSNHYCFAAYGEGQSASHQMTRKKHDKKRNGHLKAQLWVSLTRGSTPMTGGGGLCPFLSLL